jgi:hypothetical protein
MRIEPTIGRIVWFFPAVDDGRHADGQPFSAMIAGVNDDGTINLLVAARDGSPYGAQNVALKQDGDEIDLDAAHAAWMPYQKGQAAKTEALQASTTQQLAPVFERVDAIAAEITGKLEEMGSWTVKTLQDFDARLKAITSPPAAPQDAGSEPAPLEGGEAKVNADGAGAAPQTAS